jgi:hypothetical protein
MTNDTFRSLRGIAFTAAAALVLALAATPVSAQIFPLCGDVDDNDSVTVSDGVQVLRAAAELPSDCTLEICDVDQDGTIGLPDGVNILRKAAALPITDNCIPDEGTINAQVGHLVRNVEPFVEEMLGSVMARRNDTSESSFPCVNDGTLDTFFSDGQLDIDFADCLVENALISGAVENANDDPIVSLEILDQRTEDSITFDGSLLGINTEAGVKLSGNIEASPSFNQFDETSDFLLVLNSLEVSDSGTPLAGGITFVLTEDSGVAGVRRVQVFYDGSNIARVLVTFLNGNFESYGFELRFRNFL